MRETRGQANPQIVNEIVKRVLRRIDHETARIAMPCDGGSIMLKEGDKAPDFRCPADDGRTVALADFKGRNLVLYFYPKADTTGCTSEAIQFRDMRSDDFERLTRRSSAQRRFGGGAGEIQGEVQPEFSAAGRYEVRRDRGVRRAPHEELFREDRSGHRAQQLLDRRPTGRFARYGPRSTVKGHAAEVLAAIQAG